MTFEELMGVAHAAVRKAGRSTEFSDRVMVRAVVTALRDELSKCDWDEGENMIDALNEILASDGVEAGTHGSPELDEDARKLKALGQEVFAPAAAPSAQSDIAKAFEAEMRAVAAPDVCVWTQHHRTESGVRWKTSCGTLQLRHGQICVNCDRPISFKEAAR